jgi:hypothetical protein
MTKRDRAGTQKTMSCVPFLFPRRFNRRGTGDSGTRKVFARLCGIANLRQIYQSVESSLFRGIY